MAKMRGMCWHLCLVPLLTSFRLSDSQEEAKIKRRKIRPTKRLLPIKQHDVQEPGDRMIGDPTSRLVVLSILMSPRWLIFYLKQFEGHSTMYSHPRPPTGIEKTASCRKA